MNADADDTASTSGREALQALFEEAGTRDAAEPATARQPSTAAKKSSSAQQRPPQKRPPGSPPRGSRPPDDQPTKTGVLRRAPRRKLRARRVDRIMRRIDPWSVLKLAFLFNLCLWIVFLMAGTMLWTAAIRSNAIDNVETFITELFGLETFTFEGEQIFQACAVGGLILVLVGTGFSVLVSILFNLISDLTGGIRVSVIELENLRVAPSRRSSTQKRKGNPAPGASAASPKKKKKKKKPPATASPDNASKSA